MLRARLLSLFDDGPANIRFKLLGVYGLLVAANLSAWAWALLTFRGSPTLLGAAFLAYSLGLRHAFDADHIAAIDNVTRRLMQRGKRPIAVGFFFSLGHSSVVVALSVFIALTAAAMTDRYLAFKDIGGFIGTGISASFLFAVAIANIFDLIVIHRVYRARKREGLPVAEDVGAIAAQQGFVARISRPYFATIERSWHMYPLGFLCGLGFDTATEIGLLGISATSATQGLSTWSLLTFPTLFAAGMSLVDTSDGVMMLGVYGWAFVKPIRKLRYNLAVTFASVTAALLIGGLEVLSLVGDKLSLGGRLWETIEFVDDNLGILGFAIAAFFLACWLAYYLDFRVRNRGSLRTHP